jgi:hypothetical protein
MVFDHAINMRTGAMAFDEARPGERTFTVTANCALRAAKEQRDAADHAHRESPLGRLIPGYHRLP